MAFLRKLIRGISFNKKITPLKEFEFVLPRPSGHPIESGMVDSKTINWVVPPFGAGAGGHTTIFRFIYFLEQRGFTCRVIVNGGHVLGSAKHFQQLIQKSYFPIAAEVYSDAADAPPAYVTVATGWHTAYRVRDIRSTVHRCYFVQDFEPWFYAVGAEYILAEQTYRLGFKTLTAGTWLANKLAAEYGVDAQAVGFSFDRTTYFPRPRGSPRTKQIFFYARPNTERRGFELGILTLSEVSRRMPDIKIVLAGGELSKFDIPFAHTSEGTVNVNRLAELYCQSDAALVLSLTNLSLLPLELMACGALVVSNSGPWVEWMLNASNSFLAAPTVMDLADALCRALNDESAGDRIRRNGLELASRTSWEREADVMAGFFRSLAAA
jgi:glycosyltransferase involved in cell wall biosynthesis